MTTLSAESSPATTDSPVLPDLASLSAEALKTWRATGEVPTPTPADSAPAAPDDPGSSTEETAAASEAAPPETPASTKRPRGNADTRVQELLHERWERDQKIADLERRLTARETVTAPEPAAPTFETVIAKPDLSRPALTDTEFFTLFPERPYGDYSRYVARYEIAVGLAEREQATAHQAWQGTVKAKADTFLSRRQAAMEADPTFAERVLPTVGQAVPVEMLPAGSTYGPHNVAAQEIFESAVAPQLMLHFSEHPDEWQALLSLSPAAVVKAVAKVEARLDPASPKPKTVTSAPPPPTTLGGKGKPPVDEVLEASARGDWRAYRDAMNRKELIAKGFLRT